MIRHSSAPRSLLLAGAFLSAFTLGAAAQQPAASPPAAGASAAPALPPGSPLIGRPAGSEAAAKLAPNAPPPIPAAPDKLPTAKLKVPAGFNIEVYAAGMANARSLAVGDKGTVFVGSRLVDKVYAIVNKDGKREVKVLASGLYRPNGLAFKDGTLYIAELSKISKIEKVEDVLDNPPKPTVIYDKLPKDEAHGWKFIGIGPDNKLYVPVGQPGNNVLHDDDHGQIRRMNLDGSGVEVIAKGFATPSASTGIRRPSSSTSPTTAATGCRKTCPRMNSTASPRSANISARRTACRATSSTPNSAGANPAANSPRRSGLLGPHSASLGIRFYTGSMFPKAYKNAAIIARHGSWNRTKKVGGDVVVVKLNKNGTMKSMEPLITGFLEDNKYIGRPVDVLPMKDGSLLVSDDWNGAVYRITYGKQKVAGK